MATLRNAISAVKSPILCDRIAGRLNEDWGKVVVFFHHSAAGSLLHAGLRVFGAVKIDGKVPQKQREVIRQQFWEDPDCRVIIAQDNIARQAIDLSVANNLVFAELAWTPEDNYQAEMRIQGPLQTRQPHIHTTTLAGTLDEAVNAVCNRRSKMFSEIL